MVKKSCDGQRGGTAPVEIPPILCNHTGMKKTNLYESSFYIRRTWTTFSGTVTKMDHVGPYGEDQEYAVALQRKHDMDRAVPATEQITKWEWVDGVTAIADVVFG